MRGDNYASDNLFGDIPYEVNSGLTGNVNSLDFDGDGNETTSINYVLDDHGVTNDAAFSVIDTGETELVGWEDGFHAVAIDGLSGTLIGTGGTASATFTVRLTEGQTYTVAEAFNYSITVTAKVSGFGMGLDTASTIGNRTTTTNSFTASVTTQDSYTVNQEDYEAGEYVSYGQHAIYRDATISDTYAVWYKLEDDDGIEGYAVLTIEDTQVVEDYLYDVSMYGFAAADLGTNTLLV